MIEKLEVLLVAPIEVSGIEGSILLQLEKSRLISLQREKSTNLNATREINLNAIREIKINRNATREIKINLSATREINQLQCNPRNRPVNLTLFHEKEIKNKQQILFVA
ncbi:Uncharacterized protein BM_BM7865 [Brugia malayi]|uniref:Bm7865 n=1 Tax=Brugia malayi TaxID=6279 RepID=A8P2A8_BRUMA|nr:Uncharacterized protein BM_BM7865 [Brugia malayi]CDP90885.1 Bm7865 [Brugia malayi]VIO99735.1 Uncharacterized protein BM_BM7865 [Brugia malayi]